MSTSSCRPACGLSRAPTIAAAVLIALAAFALGAGGPEGVDTAAADGATPRPMQEETVSSEQELQRENAELNRLKAELDAIEALDSEPAVPMVEPHADESVAPPILPAGNDKTPPGLPQHEHAPAPLPRADGTDDQLQSIPGAEEDFANALYALGNYKQAISVYRSITESTSKPEKTAWAYLQIANCARRSNKLVHALQAYEKLMTAAPDSPWAEEASWWSLEIKWRLLWQEKLQEPVEAAARSTSSSTPRLGLQERLSTGQTVATATTEPRQAASPPGE